MNFQKKSSSTIDIEATSCALPDALVWCLYCMLSKVIAMKEDCDYDQYGKWLKHQNSFIAPTIITGVDGGMNKAEFETRFKQQKLSSMAP